MISRASAYAIEADSLSDFYYDDIPRVSMKSMDTHENVIYIKNFSNLLASGMKIGCIVYPQNFCKFEAFTPSGYNQRIFDFYLRYGGFNEHAALMRHQYGRRYRKLIQACQTYLAPYANFTVPDGGLGLWVCPKGTQSHSEAHFEKFLARRVIVSPGSMFSSTRGNMPHFHISFANMPESRIAEGIGIISAVLARAE